MPATDLARLDKLGPLQSGSHAPNGIACVMEAVAYVAGEPWSDHPKCVCPVIGAFLRSWNDGLPDNVRDTLLRPLVPLVMGTRGDKALEQRRALMAADWLVRVYTPAWLRLAKLVTQADALAGLPEITDMAQCPSLMPALEAARSDSNTAGYAAGAAARAAAWAGAWAAARAAAGAAAWDAAWAAAGAAARDAAGAAAWAAARTAARDAAWDAARDAAGAAAWAAAGAAARDALAATCRELQQSALILVRKMIAAR